MARPPHNPAQRLNDHHSDEVLAVARAFGGQPQATAARVTSVDAAGLDLLVETPAGKVETHIAFTEALHDVDVPASPRLAFRALAHRARPG
jgi:heme oxygenase (biliverdin-IX-beta and delta-forming)